MGSARRPLLHCCLHVVAGAAVFLTGFAVFLTGVSAVVGSDIKVNMNKSLPSPTFFISHAAGFPSASIPLRRDLLLAVVSLEQSFDSLIGDLDLASCELDLVACDADSLVLSPNTAVNDDSIPSASYPSPTAEGLYGSTSSRHQHHRASPPPGSGEVLLPSTDGDMNILSSMECLVNVVFLVQFKPSHSEVSSLQPTAGELLDDAGEDAVQFLPRVRLLVHSGMRGHFVAGSHLGTLMYFGHLLGTLM